MSYLESLRKIRERPWFYPGALLLIGMVTYNYALTSLGYYWADWEIMMFIKLNPALQFDYYAEDRPFPWTYQLIHFLVGANPIGWHLVTLLIRWGASLIFVYAMMLIWPRFKNHFYWLGAILMVYPGFLQQLQSATKARHIMTFLLFALSIYLMALAMKRPNWARALFPLSWLTTFLHLFTTEYFAGLELIRPLLLWLLIARENNQIRDSIRRVATYYLPYLLITVFFFWCRFIYFPSIFNTVSRIGDINVVVGGFHESTFDTLVALLNRVLFDLIYLVVQVWTNSIIGFEGFSFQNKVAWFAFGLGILLSVAFALFYDVDEREEENQASPRSILVIGFVSIVLGAIPIWAIGRQVTGGGWNDRFALAPMLGANLIVLALLLLFVRPAGQKLILGFLLVFSIAAQVWVANVYRNDWRTQLNYYWQLYWRAPALQTGTAVFSLEQPSATVTHFSDAGFALNVLYHYHTEDGSLPYWFFIRRFHFDWIPGMAIKYPVRKLMFTGNTSDAISVMRPTQGACLLVLDAVYAENPLFTEGQGILIPVSNLSRIIPNPEAAPPDPDIFGTEPPHNWCFYFQKADLARQTKDWSTVIALYKQAQQNNLTPGFGAEYIPFIEAYAQTGDWQKAQDLTLTAHKQNPGLKKMLCNNWWRLSGILSPDANVIEQVKQSLSC